MIDYLDRLVRREDLNTSEASRMLFDLVADDFDSVVAGAIITALRTKGETVNEICGITQAMIKLSVRPELTSHNAVDIVGTGGDGSNSLNLSTGSALLVAACGLPVIKHGNCAVSSKSGSADVLDSLGYEIPQSTQQAITSFEKHGFTFLFAPLFHPALSKLGRIRRLLGIRTVFNLIGPLANPAQPSFAVIGAPTYELANTLAQVAVDLSFKRAFFVHGAHDWDEPTPLGPFTLFKVSDGKVCIETRDPLAWNIPRCKAAALQGGDASYNAKQMTLALGGKTGPHRDAIVIGAALALEVSGTVPTFDAGLHRAADCIDSGQAIDFVERISRRTTQEVYHD